MIKARPSRGTQSGLESWLSYHGQRPLQATTSQHHLITHHVRLHMFHNGEIHRTTPPPPPPPTSQSICFISYWQSLKGLFYSTEKWSWWSPHKANHQRQTCNPSLPQTVHFNFNIKEDTISFRLAIVHQINHQNSRNYNCDKDWIEVEREGSRASQGDWRVTIDFFLSNLLTKPFDETFWSSIKADLVNMYCKPRPT